MLRSGLIACALSALAACDVAAQVRAQDSAPVAADSAAAEPGLADRRQRYGRPPREHVAMVPAYVLRFPFRVLNYPIEHFVIHREPGAIGVYARQFSSALGRHGIDVQIRGMGAGSNYGLGIGYQPPRRLSAGKPLRLSAVTTYTGYDELALTLDSLAAGPFGGAVRLHYAERPREDFFGTGPRSALEDHASYQLDEWLGRFDAWLPLGGGLRLTADVGMSRADVGRGRDPDLPSVLEVFPATTSGLDGRFEFLEWGAGLVYDTRDDPSYARRGQRFGGRVAFAEGLRRTPHAYVKYEAEAQQFVPLWGERRSLALRLRAAITENQSGEAGIDVPVFRLERVGGSRTIRGYDSFRFQDKDAFVGNFEYRFPIWNIEPPGRQALDGAALFDFGTAVPDLARVQQRDLRSAAGIGVRFATRDGLVFRLDNLWSPEGFRAHFGLRGTF